jgi:hypothetical protein
MKRDGGCEAALDVIRNGFNSSAMAAYPSGISDAVGVQVATYVWPVSRGKAKA